MPSSPPTPTIPLAFGFLGLATLFVVSGLKGHSVADTFKGGATGPLDPAATLTPLDSPVADALNATTGGDGSGVAGLSPPTIPGQGPTGSLIIDGHPVAAWIAPQVMCARRNGWTGTVTSGVRSYAEQQAACQRVCGNPAGCPGTCAAPGTSNHRGTVWPLGAVDVSNPDQFEAALKHCPSARGLRRALPNDRVHFSWTGR